MAVEEAELEGSLAELLVKEATVVNKWTEAVYAVRRIENLSMQAEMEFWTGAVEWVEGDSCSLLGCPFEYGAAVLVNKTSTPISFAYLHTVLKRAREVMKNYGSQYEGEAALKILQDPYTRQPIVLIKAVRVYDPSDIEVLQ